MHERQPKKAGYRTSISRRSPARKSPGSEYDLVAFFDCLHDTGDPVSALSHAREILKSDGTCMLVEPFAHDSLAENLNPVGRVF